MLTMAKNERYPDGYQRPSIGVAGGSAQMTAFEDLSAPIRKRIRLNCDNFSVPVQVHHLSIMSPSEKKDLVNRMRLELEQICIFQKKIESTSFNRTPLSSFSDIHGYSNGLSVHAALAKPNKGNEDGPKGNGLNQASSSLFDPVQLVSAPGSSMRMAMKQCETLLERLMAHNYAHVFGAPVDVVKWNIPDYSTIIKQPMDLGTVKGKLTSGAYSNPHEFVADVRLTFTNAMTYNPPKNDVHIMAKTLSKFFEVRWKTVEKKLPTVHAEPVPESLGAPQNVDASGLRPPLKKRKVSEVQHNSIPQPVQRIMTTEEKHCLSKELESFLGELPENIINFLKEHCSNEAETGEDEIEIDLDVLRDETLFELRKLLDGYLQEKQENNNKMAESCEIELLHGSGTSNSSMQAGKENDAADEEIDIGGSEPPVSSYPPVEIYKDLGQISDSEPSSSSDDPCNADAPCNTSLAQEEIGFEEAINKKTSVGNLHEDYECGGGLDQVEQNHEPNETLAEDSESAPGDRQLSPDKLYRAALLKSRFADTILKAREKTLNQVQVHKGDPEKLRREREELELQKRKEKARLQAEAKAAEDLRRRAEAEAAAEAKKRRELEREAARQALLQMEKTVEINENCHILEDLEKLRTGPGEHLPSSVDETSPDQLQEGMGGFRFEGCNPLEQLGLFMKEEDDEEEEAEPPSMLNGANDVEEGEI